MDFPSDDIQVASIEFGVCLLDNVNEQLHLVLTMAQEPVPILINWQVVIDNRMNVNVNLLEFYHIPALWVHPLVNPQHFLEVV